MRVFIKLFIACIAVLCITSCQTSDKNAIDILNEKSYDFHYRNLDSTRYYALLALSQAQHYDGGKAEALNNLAFVDIAHMRYATAEKRLNSISGITNNQLELLIADVQMMRLCQRQSRNKSFYEFQERAESRLRRISTEQFTLNNHEQKRFTYAESEYRLVASAYYYYLGLTKQSVDMIKGIDPYGPIERDTAQLLNYWYNIGSGGIILNKPAGIIAQEEFKYLISCYSLAEEADYPYWKAQAMQALSEHFQNAKQREQLIKSNYPSILYINPDQMPDTLLAGNLAQRSYELFHSYHDVYQMAGALRTLAECYWHIGDYKSALICLKKALADKNFVNQAPDLVASIREQLCLVYSAANDKVNSDRNRNIYLDLQEKTRQDQQLEARASQLSRSSILLNVMIITVVVMIIIVTALLIIFAKMRKRSDDQFSINALLEPLRQWQKQGEKDIEERKEQMEEIAEETGVARLHLQQNRLRNLEQRAKVQLVNSALPLIDRMVNEVNRLISNSDGQQEERFEYISALTDSIDQYNKVLTQWIQMRQGEVNLKIENFAVQKLFDIVSHSSMGFRLKGITLKVIPTNAIVKADRVLTLFMINTIADNARKFTPQGGTVTVEATPSDQYVEISISDNGKGMDDDTLGNIFNRTYTGGHGFGLKNCNGIIEKYKKLSKFFSVCCIGAKSKVGMGTRIFFRLPLGKMRSIISIIVVLIASLLPANIFAASSQSVNFHNKDAKKAMQYADSAYLSNVLGHYERTLQFADSCMKYASVKDTATLLDVSNERAVAALALHKWDLYHKSNDFYTHLFREASADSSLPQYVRAMQRNNANKTVAVVMLIMLFVIIFPAYYFLYYRHKLNYKFCIDRINRMNSLLLSDANEEKKLKGIEQLKDFSQFNLTDEQRQSLNSIVKHIEKALNDSIKNKNEQETKAELANDELRRLKLDSDKLYISNSVLDNCLSALKHETMYYPSRIKQLVNGEADNLQAIKELVDYYHDLYAILSEQATRQVIPQRIDKDTVDTLLDILKKCNKNSVPIITIAKPQKELPDSYDDARYTKWKVKMDKLRLTQDQASTLLTPSTIDLNYLLCRQIVREMGEASNLRACGISAYLDDSNDVMIDILIPKRFAELKA